jgi:hypothetical protein
MRARSSKTESRGSARFGLGPWLLLASVALVMCSPNTCRAWYFNCGADTGRLSDRWRRHGGVLARGVRRPGSRRVGPSLHSHGSARREEARR